MTPVKITIEVPDYILDQMEEAGLISELSLRDFRIKQEYPELMRHGFFAKEAMDFLAEKYQVTYSCVRNIVYFKSKPYNLRTKPYNRTKSGESARPKD